MCSCGGDQTVSDRLIKEELLKQADRFGADRLVSDAGFERTATNSFRLPPLAKHHEDGVRSAKRIRARVAIVQRKQRARLWVEAPGSLDTREKSAHLHINGADNLAFGRKISANFEKVVAIEQKSHACERLVAAWDEADDKGAAATVVAHASVVAQGAAAPHPGVAAAKDWVVTPEKLQH